MHAWHLERVAAIREQFRDPNKVGVGVQINQQFNGNGTPGGLSSEDLELMRKRLNEIKLRQAKWKAGVATNAELRETMIRQIEQYQHVVDCIDADKTPNQEEQQQLYQDLTQSSSRQQQPVREAIGHVVDKPLELEGGSEPTPEPDPESEPQRTVPRNHSMCASDMDPLSGQSRRQSEGSGDDRQVNHPAAEPEHIRQTDQKPMTGPMSTRQRWAAAERARRGGDGKQPF
jgi:hypothetical protein